MSHLTFEDAERWLQEIQPDLVSTRIALRNRTGRFAVMEELSGGFELPGGGVHIATGETLQEGSVRECEEETGIRPERLMVARVDVAYVGDARKMTLGILGQVNTAKRIRVSNNPKREHRRGRFVTHPKAVDMVDRGFDMGLLQNIKKYNLSRFLYDPTFSIEVPPAADKDTAEGRS